MLKLHVVVVVGEVPEDHEDSWLVTTEARPDLPVW